MFYGLVYSTENPQSGEGTYSRLPFAITEIASHKTMVDDQDNAAAIQVAHKHPKIFILVRNNMYTVNKCSLCPVVTVVTKFSNQNARIVAANAKNTYETKMVNTRKRRPLEHVQLPPRSPQIIQKFFSLLGVSRLLFIQLSILRAASGLSDPDESDHPVD
jgi:hypothetical protein